jgi:hypothetical protein
MKTSPAPVQQVRLAIQYFSTAAEMISSIIGDEKLIIAETISSGRREVGRSEL